MVGVAIILAALVAFLVIGIVRDIRDAAEERKDMREAEEEYDGDGFGEYKSRK